MEKNTKSEVYSWGKSIVFAIIVAFICRQFIFTPSTVQGESMQPTLEDENRVILTKTSEIQHFDMIVFNAPDSDERYIKRVIGLPGDFIEVKDDVLYINGKAYEEPYLDENKDVNLLDKLTYDFTLEEVTGESTVPENSLFVMGDNRLNSKDSRIFGCISRDSIIGEVKFRFYPLQEIGILK